MTIRKFRHPAMMVAFAFVCVTMLWLPVLKSLLSHVSPPVPQAPLVLGIESNYSRLDLLAHMWGVNTLSLWSLLVGAFVATLIGVTCLFAGLSRFIATTCGVFLLTLGLSLVHSVVSPPFHAPDEPGHYAGFVRTIPAADLQVERMFDLSKLSHFQDVYRNSAKKFQLRYVFEHRTEGWIPNSNGTDMNWRSPAVAKLWSMVGAATPRGLWPHLLLILRLCHAFIFALLVTFSWMLMMSATRDGAVLSFAFVTFLSIPALPFFAMHVSNYGPLTGFLVLAACALFRLAYPLNFTNPLVGAAFSGFLTSLVVVPSVFASSSIVLLSFIAGAVGIGFIRSVSRPFLVDIVAVIFAGFSWSVLAFVLPGYAATAVLTAASTIGLPATCPMWIILGLMGSACWVAGVVLGTILRPITGTRAFRFAHVLIGIATLILIAWNATHPLGRLMEIELNPAYPKWDYVREVLWTFLRSVGSLRPDHSLVEAFWVGFGWLERGMPSLFFAFLHAVPFGMILLGSVFWISHTDYRRGNTNLALLVWGVVGSVVCFTVLTVIYHAGPSNMHGRYMIGTYLVMLGSMALYFGDSLRRDRLVLRAATVTWYFFALASHGFALRHLVRRYIA